MKDETQIQTHMCYSEFRDIMDAISDLDADVLLIWHVRSQMELLEYWKKRGYDKDIAPGVYDIHSPRVPSAEEMTKTLRAGERGPAGGAALGRARLRPQDAPLRRGRAVAAQHGAGGQAAAGRVGSGREVAEFARFARAPKVA